jgi:hypothetical protein
MEFVTVRFPELRVVLIDGEEAGETNAVLRVNEGTHTIKLAPPKDYRPAWRRPQIAGTTSIEPMEVTFEKL